MDILIKSDEKENKKRMVALELPETLYQRLRKEAFEREVSLSAIIRLILDTHYLDREIEENC